MNSEIRWLLRLGIDQLLFTLAQVQPLRSKLRNNVTLLDFAQMLIDEAIVGDEKLEELERLANLAQSKAAKGPPAADPLDDEPMNDPPAFRGPTSMASASATLPPSPPSGVSRPSATTAPFKRRGGDTTPPMVAKAVAAQSASAAPFASAPTSSVGPARRETMPPIPSLGAADVAAGPFPFDRIPALSDNDLARHLRGLLIACGQQAVSDLHLSAGARPFVRHRRELREIYDKPLTPEAAERLNTVLLTAGQRVAYKDARDLDYALAIDAANRYRVNLMYHKVGAAGSYRLVPASVPTLERLGLRNVELVRKLLSYHNGLILVTGPVGAGKSTTLAALVAELNATRDDHIITVEDPIEVVQPALRCNVTQREVGRHTRTFASALKGALREDPDVIVIGELRDLETIEMAITASETGHLVIGTMHTSDAATTLNRLLDVFPPAQQPQIRASVAESLRGIICQRLLPSVDGSLVMAVEMLVNNPAIGSLIRDGKMQGLRNVLETGVRDGMCLMDNVVAELHTQGRITAEVARQNIVNRLLRNRLVG
jgi:twitching motility protein PilT